MADTVRIQSGSFIPTTNVWDVAQIQNINVNSAEFKELLVRLVQNINNIANVLNVKDSGFYNTNLEFVTGQQFFQNPNKPASQTGNLRQTYRMVVNFGALPAAGTKSVAHNIPIMAGYTFTRIYATASDTTGLNFIPIPYAANSTSNIELSVDATNVKIDVNGTDRSNFDICYVILEYMKQ